MNTRKGKGHFKNFLILLDNRCSYTILLGGIIQKLNPKEDDMIQWCTKVGSINTSIKVQMDFNLPKLSVTEIVM